MNDPAPPPEDPRLPGSGEDQSAGPRRERRKRQRRGGLIGRTDDDDALESTRLPPTVNLANAGGVTAAALVGLLLLGIVYTLFIGRALLIPFAAAVLLGFLLQPVVRLLRAFGIPEMLGTLIVFVSFIGTIAGSGYLLADPAAEWLSRLPAEAEQAEERLRTVFQSVGEVREAVDDVAEVSERPRRRPTEPDVVRVAPESLSTRLIGSVRAFVIGTAGTAVLLFLLLSSGETFLRRTVSMLPTLNQKKRLVRIMHGIERDLSVYMLTTSMINAGLGIVVGFVLFLIGVPNPVLWGVAVAILNFVPYIGGFAGVIMIGLVSLASVEETGRALLAPAAYLLINGLEAYVITPHVLGARFSLNPVAVFCAVVFWGWIWGIPGALLAVPILTAASIVCSNVDRLRPIALFLRA